MTFPNNQHPSTKIQSSFSNRLEGKQILLGITGSIASFLSPKLARELMRHGATVIPVMTKSAITMIGKDLMWWATGNEPIIDVTGNLEHIQFAGVMNKPADLMLIMPCTTNTAAKLASGISDTSVTLIANTIRGRNIPIMIMCVAHEDLIKSPPVQESLTKLKNSGITVLDPVIEEGKAKVPDTDDIVMSVFMKLESNELEGKNVIITAGPTREFIDEVRFISNPSSGRTGIELAKEAMYHGASVDLVLGPTQLTSPFGVNSNKVISSEEMTKKCLELLESNPDSIVILTAAMGDFTMDKLVGKIKSGNNLELTLKPTAKLSSQIKHLFPNSTLILFKAEAGLSKDDLIKSAITKLKNDKADLIIANDIADPSYGFSSEENHVIVITKNEKTTELTDSKSNLARLIIPYLFKGI
ncbi:MAG: bifunctional phosphopantothenoylcysteine decarboxylase/phosphopantothenate--cysteine ligase CoaBC [Candidatus Heimdallarchaeota archaeon]|nr:bifunctional phosphopantothenoylcysteine decarboxylase/phosphopantothenate--cysteine ligase CoaBC [Candidatus Heimdallarchaeota archaeon]